MACSRLARRTQKKDRDSTCCALNIRERPKVKRKREEDRRQGTRIVAELYFSPCSVESQRSDVKKKKKKNRKSVRHPRKDASSNVGGICEVRTTVSTHVAPRYATDFLNYVFRSFGLIRMDCSRLQRITQHLCVSEVSKRKLNLRTCVVVVIGLSSH